MKKLFILFLIPFILLLNACDTLKQRVQEKDPFLTLLTGRVIHEYINKSDNPKDRAERVARAATIIKNEVDSDAIVSFEELRSALIAEIPKEKLLPGEYVLISDLINDLVTELETRAQEKFGDQFEDSKTTVLYFLNIAIDTAQYNLN